MSLSPSGLSAQLDSTKSLSNQLQSQMNNLISHYEEKVQQVLQLEKEWTLKNEQLAISEQSLKEQKEQLQHDEKHLLGQVEEQKKQMITDLEEREERISSIEKKVASSSSIATRLGKNQVIKLNVGGKIFATNFATITSVKETFFTGYFNDHFDPKPEEEDNAFFIDRPFEQFHLILNYLRGIDIKQKISMLSEIDLLDFIEEVVYYQIVQIYDILPPKGIKLLKTKFGLNHKSTGGEDIEFKRFTSEANVWTYGGESDSLDFKISDSSSLSCIQLYAADNSEYIVKLEIIRRDSSLKIYNDQFTFTKTDSLKYYTYKLKEEVIIEEGVWYGVIATINGAPSPKATNCVTTITLNGHTVEFSLNRCLTRSIPRFYIQILKKNISLKCTAESMENTR